MFPGSSCCTWIETNGNIVLCVWAIQILSQYLGKEVDNSFISLLSHWHTSPVCYKTVSTSVDMLTILNELSRAPYNIYPRSIEIMIISFGNGSERKRKKYVSFGFQNDMVASFQAPCAAPGQRQMEMHHVSLIIFYCSMLLWQITQVCTKWLW